MGAVRTELRDARTQAKLTMAQAAAASGYASKTGWANIELGRQDAPVERKLAMAKALGKPATEVFPELKELLNA